MNSQGSSRMAVYILVGVGGIFVLLMLRRPILLFLSQPGVGLLVMFILVSLLVLVFSGESLYRKLTEVNARERRARLLYERSKLLADLLQVWVGGISITENRLGHLDADRYPEELLNMRTQLHTINQTLHYAAQVSNKRSHIAGLQAAYNLLVGNTPLAEETWLSMQDRYKRLETRRKGDAYATQNLVLMEMQLATHPHKDWLLSELSTSSGPNEGLVYRVLRSAGQID